MTFTAPELRLLQASDDVIERPTTRREKMRQNWLQWREREIERLGREEYNRRKAESVRLSNMRRSRSK